LRRDFSATPLFSKIQARPIFLETTIHNSARGISQKYFL
jgi:hypothetical protein